MGMQESNERNIQKYRKEPSKNGWIYWGLCISFLMALAYLFLEGVFGNGDYSTGILAICVTMGLGFIWPAKSLRGVWRKSRVCGLPLEIFMLVGYVIISIGIMFLPEAQIYINKGILQYKIVDNLHIGYLEANIAGRCIMVLLTLFACFCGWYFGVSIRAIFELGFWKYLKEKCLIVRCFIWMKNLIQGAYRSLEKVDLSKNTNKIILKIVIFNALILLVISCLWYGGFAVALIYSIVLYFLLRKYVSNIQKRYTTLLYGMNEIAQGNLNVSISEDLGVFEPLKPQIDRIQQGFQKAVENEVKSQRMKSELITNVSHDLKTPLTAIITYINLLKEQNITEEQREEYLDTLERKSLRLKVLIEDLFEVSKANTKDVTLNYMNVDILNLVKQVSVEMSDKLNAAELDVRMNLPEGKIMLSLDNQKTFRVYENLFGNIAKYAMPGTRVYVSGVLKEDCMEVVLRNITAQEITVDSKDLTERFVRNDTSRNTEGSGLGLAIAKSFMEIQGGKLLIDVDGDLFKVTTRWPIDRRPLEKQ